MPGSDSKPGDFSWNELMTTDTEAAASFYTQVFGWTTEAFPMPDFDYTMLKRGEEPVAGLMPIPKEAEGVPPHWGSYVTVEDTDATVKKAEELGAQILMGPQDIEVGRIATIRDPQGAVINVIKYA